jgi:hypothetical protein
LRYETEAGKVSGSAPEKVTSTNHVNVALPFSKLEVREPGDQMITLAILVRDLARLLAQAATPAPEADEILNRAEKLVASMH